MPHSRFSALLAQNDLPTAFIYLAPVLPIVQVMWADGRNQIAERAQIQVFIESHCVALSEMAGGLEVVSIAEREAFDRIFVANRPEPFLLEAISEAAAEIVQDKADKNAEVADSLYQRDQLLHACLEIAAACPVEPSPWITRPLRERIVDEERKLIERVFELLPRLR